MKFNSFRFVILSSFIVFLTSCLGTTDTTTVSSDASFVSLILAGNDSVKLAKFTLNADGKTIENLDSLPFNSRIDSVYPTFSFTSSARSFLHITIDQGFKFTKGKKDSVQITGKDTVDFLQPLISVSNFATDGKSYKSYTIKLNVHKVQPELYVWSKVRENLDSRNIISQKAIIFNDIINYYVSDGSTTYIYSSTDGNVWSSPTTVNGLPINPTLGDMTQFNGKLYLTQNNDMIYSTSTGTDWAVKSIPDYYFKSLLFTFQDKLWAVVQSKSLSVNRFATSTDGVEWIIGEEIPASFPVSDFASLAFSSRTGKPKVIVLGGHLDNGELSNHCWSTEGLVLNGSIYWVDFNFDNNNHSLDTLAAGASVIAYDKKLLMFGLRKDNSMSHFKQSIDEGLSWQTPDTLYNRLRQVVITKVSETKNDTAYVNYQPCNYQSVVIYKPRTYNAFDTKVQDLESNRIFIIGGKTATSVKTDVWTGKLNRKNFLLQ